MKPTKVSHQNSLARVALVISCSVILWGCQAAQQIAQSTPAASTPAIFDTRAVPDRFNCWNSLSQCYVTTSHSNQRESWYQFSFLVGYHVLNTLSIDEDGVAVTRTENSNPPGDRMFYTLSEASNLNQGRGDATVFLFPKQSPDSRSHGETSVIRITETSSNPQYHGTPQEKATSELRLTYVDPGRCAIQDFHSDPTQVTTGNNIAVQWHAVNCKKIQLYRDFRPSSGGVIAGSGSYVHPPEYQETGTAFEQELSGTRTFRGLSAGTETYRLRATNALGKAVDQTITATVSQPSSGGSASPSPNGCTPQSFNICLNCPNLYDSELSSLACTEQLAKTQAEQANPGCTASVGTMQDFTFCLQCPNGEHRTITARGCTEAGARVNAQRQHPSECQVNSGQCN